MNTTEPEDVPTPFSIHEPDYDNESEPFTFYGLAAYWAQCFEQSMILLIAGLKFENPSHLSEDNMEEVFATLDQKTLGNLIRDASNIVPLENDLAKRLSILLKQRNYLIHHFFHKNAEKLLSENGRRQLLDELRLIAQAFLDGDRVVVNIYQRIWKKFGMTEEIAQREFEKLKNSDP